MICENCGSEQDEGRFCGNCGARLHEASLESTQDSPHPQIENVGVAEQDQDREQVKREKAAPEVNSEAPDK